MCIFIHIHTYIYAYAYRYRYIYEIICVFRYILERDFANDTQLHEPMPSRQASPRDIWLQVLEARQLSYGGTSNTGPGWRVQG